MLYSDINKKHMNKETLEEVIERLVKEYLETAFISKE
jgi:hypothetical protein